MNKLYILLLLLFINIFFINYSLSIDTQKLENGDDDSDEIQILNSIQNSTANEIIRLLDGDNKQVATPCSHKYFKCRLIHKNDKNNNKESSYYSITSILLPTPNNNSIFINITSDLTVFQDLESIKIKDTSKILLPSSFYNNLNKFKNIRKIVTYYQISPIDESIKLPSSLSTYQVYYVGTKFGFNFFNSSLSKIIFSIALDGYEIPKLQSNYYNEHLTSLKLPLSINSPTLLTTNGSSLPNLKSLSILIEFQANSTNSNLVFPSIDSFSTLTNLSISTVGDNEDPLFQLPNFTNMKDLIELNINGNLFYSLKKSSVILDLSNSNNLNLLKLWHGFYLNNCTGKPCIKFSDDIKDISIVTTFTDYNISNLNFDNIGSLKVLFNLAEQPLPELPSDKNIELVIESSKIIDSIPQSYCGRNIDISNNEMRGFVPDCFLCEESNKSILKGNFFKNYNDSYNPTCPNFKINSITNSPIKTDGSEGIIISGNDIGYGISSKFDYKVLVPNKKIQVFPGKGFGKSNDIKLNFFYNPTFDYQLHYSYELPTIQYYNISNVKDTSKNDIMVTGQGFNYINENQFYINGVCYNGSIAKDGSSKLNANSDSKTGPTNPFKSLKNGDSFEIYSVVGDQKSNPSTFIYLTESISIDNSSLPKDGLSINGGQINIKGSFFTSNQSLVSVNINNKSCKILKLTDSSILIKYPTVDKVGNYSLLLKIGGNLFETLINYNSNDRSKDSSDNNNSNNKHSSESVENTSSHNNNTNHNSTNSDNKTHSSSHHNNDSTNDSQFFPNSSKPSSPTPPLTKTPTPTKTNLPTQTPSQTHENIITTTPSPTPKPNSKTGVIVSLVFILISILAITLFIVYKKPELKHKILRKLGLSHNGNGNRYSMLSREMMPNSFEDIDNEYENELDQFL